MRNLGEQWIEEIDGKKHTKEPWYVVPVDDMYEIHSDSADVVWSIDSIANAKRIVACVNACAVITNEALEAGYIKHLVDSVKTPFEFKGVPIKEDV